MSFLGPSAGAFSRCSYLKQGGIRSSRTGPTSHWLRGSLKLSSSVEEDYGVPLPETSDLLQGPNLSFDFSLTPEKCGLC